MRMSDSFENRLAILAFMAAVTAYLLARTAAELAAGPGGALEVGVYGFSGVLGLQFVATAWRGLWGRSGAGSQTRA